MKRIALFLILILLPLEMLADSVSLQRARRLADTFMSVDGTRAGNLTLTCAYGTDSRPMEGTRADGDAALYVFNRPGGGFVIVSGDDSFGPVLAYSYTETFREDASMPANLRGWIEEMTGSIADLRSSHAAATPKVAERWALYENPTRAGIRKSTAVKFYTTALWNQGNPFNLFCPKVGDQYTITGCVATSIGILMKYYEYPTRVKGPIPAIGGDGYMVPLREIDYDYDWSSMLMSYTEGNYTQAQAEACARLLADIGQVGGLDYGVSSTGGQTADVLYAMADYFGYDRGIVNDSRYYYTDDEWRAKLKAELDQRPMSYTGRSSTGGHAFVMDGYDTDDYFHINWGWSGSSNGFFDINALGKYTKSHAATFGFKPDAGGYEVPNYSIYVGTTSAGVAYKGIEMVSKGITPGSVFQVKVGGIINRSYKTFSGDVAVGHCDKDGNLKEIVSSTAMTISDLDRNYWRGYQSVNCMIAKPVEPGDRLRVYYRITGGDWIRIHCPNNEGAVDEIIIENELSIDASSYMTYDKTAQTLTLSTKMAASISISAASGASVASHIAISPGIAVFNLAILPKDTYRVTISLDGQVKYFEIVR